MNLKKKIKRFFTLTRKENSGFTLVELIVVIAILGVLGGVAVPVYSGYVNKANRAADEQLLAAVNKAFAAACVINGADNFRLNSVPRITLDGEVGAKTVKTISIFEDDFMRLYKEDVEDEGEAFKVFFKLEYNEQLGMFVAYDKNGSITIEYAGASFMIPEEYIVLMETSTFITADTLGGTDGLLNKIADVSDFASVIVGQGGNASDLLQGVLGSNEFTTFAAKALGIDPTDVDAFQAKDEELIAALRRKPGNEALSDTELRNKYQTNAAVLFAASNATNMNKDEIMASLTKADVKQDIINTMSTDKTKAFSQATMAYGMYTAWAHATGNTDAQGKDELDVMNDLNNPQFQAWLSTSQAESDLEGYLAALKVVDSSSSDAGAVSELVVNGFNDSALQEAVSGLFE